MNTSFLSPDYKQRGRASIEFLTHTFRGSSAVRSRAESDCAAAAGIIKDLPEDLDQRAEFMKERLRDSLASRVRRCIGEWYSRNHGEIATQAFEEVLPSIQTALDQSVSGPANLHLDPEFKAPTYWDGVDYHRTKGGWDGHEYAGFIHGEIIHRKMVDAIFPGGIFRTRRMVAELAPKSEYDRILEMGCSTGHYTCALSETYPNAKIVGVDLSLRTLEHARRVANAHGWNWDLFQRAAENSQFEDESFDLVTSFILLHEVPSRIITKIFAEAYRVLKSGGDLVMSDVARYSSLNKLEMWRADMAAKVGGEPHWRDSASADLVQIAKTVGFVDVEGKAHGSGGYPYVVRGRKP